MYSKSKSEPVEHRRDLNKGEKSRCELVVASADAPMAFDTAEEVFDAVSLAIVAAVESDGSAAVPLRRDAESSTLPTESCAERISIEALVGNRLAVPQGGQQWFNRVQIVPLSRGDSQGDGATPRVNNRGELGVNASLGATDRLLRLAPGGVGAVLVQLDVRAIDVTELAISVLRDQLQHPGEQIRATPAPKPSVDRTPRSERRRQIPPGHARAQNVEDATDNRAVILRRSSSPRPPAGFGPQLVNFFSPSHTGSGSINRWIEFMRAVRSTPRTLCSSDFEYTA